MAVSTDGTRVASLFPTNDSSPPTSKGSGEAAVRVAHYLTQNWPDVNMSVSKQDLEKMASGEWTAVYGPDGQHIVIPAAVRFAAQELLKDFHILEHFDKDQNQLYSANELRKFAITKDVPNMSNANSATI